jgi:hypothetical protein
MILFISCLLSLWTLISPDLSADETTLKGFIEDCWDTACASGNIASACSSIVWVISSMASIEVSGIAVRGRGCCRPVLARTSGTMVIVGIAPGIVSVFSGGAALVGRTPALLRDLVVAPWGLFCCDIVSGCSLCTAEVSWSLLCTQPLMFGARH